MKYLRAVPGLVTAIGVAYGDEVTSSMQRYFKEFFSTSSRASRDYRQVRLGLWWIVRSAHYAIATVRAKRVFWPPEGAHSGGAYDPITS